MTVTVGRVRAGRSHGGAGRGPATDDGQGGAPGRGRPGGCPGPGRLRRDSAEQGGRARPPGGRAARARLPGGHAGERLLVRRAGCQVDVRAARRGWAGGRQPLGWPAEPGRHRIAGPRALSITRAARTVSCRESKGFDGPLPCPAPSLDPTPRPGRHIAAGGRVAPGAPAAAGCRRRHPAAHFKFERLRKGMECWPVFSAAIW